MLLLDANPTIPTHAVRSVPQLVEGASLNRRPGLAGRLPTRCQLCKAEATLGCFRIELQLTLAYAIVNADGHVFFMSRTAAVESKECCFGLFFDPLDAGQTSGCKVSTDHRQSGQNRSRFSVTLRARAGVHRTVLSRRSTCLACRNRSLFGRLLVCSENSCLTCVTGLRF